MRTTKKLFAIGTTVAVLGLSTAAFAGPDIGPTNEQQYQVSAQESLIPQFFKPAAPMARQTSMAAATTPWTSPLGTYTYEVSAPTSLQPMPAPKRVAANPQSGIGNLIGPANPHWGPAFDPDVE